MQPGPLSELDRRPGSYGDPLTGVGADAPLWERVQGGSDGVAAALAGAVLFVTAALVATAAVSSDGVGWQELLGRSLAGHPADPADGGILDIVRTVEAALYPQQDGCLRWQLCRMGQSSSWQPLQSMLGAGVAWFSDNSEDEVDLMAKLKAVAEGAMAGDCRAYPRCSR
ncbi:uncharacterized protein LOC119099032 [Pollicipes pollicipes]|uniref:uncharacterized protein LOC119099032 n=1 Tax=Pollicipes pollicipes TaxID=41117 RepID=UPI0018854AC8|nr:uncharacterized protein LOC119099032 [Pollicipes pollicipes]